MLKVEMSFGELHLDDCADVIAELPKRSIQGFIADPPYGAGIEDDWWKYGSPVSKRNGGDDVMDTGWLKSLYKALANDSAGYIFTRWDVLGQWQSAIEGAGFKISGCIVWDKVLNGLGDTRYWAPSHEHILFVRKGSPVMPWPKRLPSVIRLSRTAMPEGRFNHAYQKPEALYRILVQATFTPGMTILDPFMGTGSAGVEVVRHGCRYIGVERDAGIFGTAVQRMYTE